MAMHRARDIHLAVGAQVRRGGCITKLIGVINRPQFYLEKMLGFHVGRLDRGWYLLLLQEMPTPDDFDFFGYTHFPGGKMKYDRPAGRLEEISVEENLKRQFGAFGLRRQKERTIGDTFTLEGPDRLVKIVPKVPHDPQMPDDRQYPIAGGLPQWCLVRPKQFIVGAFVQPGFAHLGGGIQLGYSPVDPKLMQTLGR